MLTQRVIIKTKDYMKNDEDKLAVYPTRIAQFS